MKILFIGSRLFDDLGFYLEEESIESILTESNPDALNLDLSDKYFIVPRGMDEPLKIAKSEKVDGIISLIGLDDPLMDVAIAKEKAESELKIPFIASNTYSIGISSDKIKTKEFFVENEITTPKYGIIDSVSPSLSIASNSSSDSIVDVSSLNPISFEFPLVLKQRSGQGGRDIIVATNIDEFRNYIYEFGETLCEEFIEGSELSIEVLGFNDEYLPLVPVYKGETTIEGIHPLNKVKSAPAEIDGLDNNELRNIASKIAKSLKAEGIIDIDFIFSKVDKQLYALEINTRPSGTRYLTAASSNIHPLTKLIDMVSGKFDINTIEKEVKDYFALEIPIGNFRGFKKDEPLKKFTKNSWVVHGPPDYERITISGESKNKTKKLAKKLIGDKYEYFNLNKI